MPMTARLFPSPQSPPVLIPSNSSQKWGFNSLTPRNPFGEALLGISMGRGFGAHKGNTCLSPLPWLIPSNFSQKRVSRCRRFGPHWALKPLPLLIPSIFSQKRVSRCKSVGTRFWENYLELV